MPATPQEAKFGIAFLIGAVGMLVIAIRGLLGFPIVLWSKYDGLKRLTGRHARVGGAVVLLFALIVLGLGILILLGV